MSSCGDLAEQPDLRVLAADRHRRALLGGRGCRRAPAPALPQPDPGVPRDRRGAGRIPGAGGGWGPRQVRGRRVRAGAAGGPDRRGPGRELRAARDRARRLSPRRLCAAARAAAAGARVPHDLLGRIDLGRGGRALGPGRAGRAGRGRGARRRSRRRGASRATVRRRCGRRSGRCAAAGAVARHAALRAAGHVYLHELMETHDAVEGLRAFTEKRRPVWRHA